jgi:hypothetical protein
MGLKILKSGIQNLFDPGSGMKRANTRVCTFNRCDRRAPSGAERESDGWKEDGFSWCRFNENPSRPPFGPEKVTN